MKIIFIFLILIKLINGIEYQPNWSSINSRPIPQWYDQAKFGIFIHWGVFSVPHFAGPSPDDAVWYWYYLKHPWSDNGATAKFHNETYGSSFPYQKFASEWQASFFDPDQWADLFQSAGAKYVVLTSKHHDGFCLWDSPESWGWNSVDLGPTRDLVGDLSNSVKKAGLHMGLYHSLYEWYNPFYLQDNSTTPPVTDTYVEQVLLPQLKDIVEKYSIDVIWADGQWEQNSSYWQSTNFLSWLYNNATVKDTVVVNDRWGSDCLGKNGGFYTVDDRYNPGHLLDHKWENCYTIGSNWGYDAAEPFSDIQNATFYLFQLVSTVSCGGNLLLDVGPTQDGNIPWIMQERLLQIGQWLNLNGESIYSSQPWRSQQDVSGNNEIWYTTRPDLTDSPVYAISFEWPISGSLVLTQPIPTSTTTISLLGCLDNAVQCNNLSFAVLNSNQDQGVTIQLPNLAPQQYPPHFAYVFKLINVK